jgi:hypothetical protein
LIVFADYFQYLLFFLFVFHNFTSYFFLILTCRGRLKNNIILLL